MKPWEDPAKHVVGPEEARKLLGHISRSRFVQLRQDEAFPEATFVSGRPIWGTASIRAFQEDRTRDTRRRRSTAIAHYQLHGNVAQAAATVQVHPDTLRQWLRKLDIPLPRDHLTPDPSAEPASTDDASPVASPQSPA